MKINNNVKQIGFAALRQIFPSGNFIGADGLEYIREFHTPIQQCMSPLHSGARYEFEQNSLSRTYTYYAIWGAELGIEYLEIRLGETYYDAISRVVERRNSLPTHLIGIVDTYLTTGVKAGLSGSVRCYAYKIPLLEEMCIQQRFLKHKVLKIIDGPGTEIFYDLEDKLLPCLEIVGTRIFATSEGDWSVKGKFVYINPSLNFDVRIIDADYELLYDTRTKQGLIYVYQKQLKSNTASYRGAMGPSQF